MKFSSLARPPIQPHEAERAEESICRNHDGLVLVTGDREGRVMFCPIGREYWRYTKQQTGMFAPLSYEKL